MPEIEYEPLCQQRDICPDPSNPDWHRCLVCDSPEVQHAHVLSRALRPDMKMDPDNIVPLCERHHTEVDQHKMWHAVVDFDRGRTYIRGKRGGLVTFERRLDDPEVRVEEGGSQGKEEDVGGRSGPVCRRGSEGDHEPTGCAGSTPAAPIIPPLTADWSVYSDDDLTAIFQQAEKAKSGAFLCMCKAVWQFRENHERTRGESWTEEAYSRFHASRRTLQAWAGFWDLCASLPDASLDQVGTVAESRDLVQLVGRSEKAEKGPLLLEAAVDYAAEYGEPPSRAALLHKVGVEAGERKQLEYACADCGSTNVQRREVAVGE